MASLTHHRFQDLFRVYNARVPRLGGDRLYSNYRRTRDVTNLGFTVRGTRVGGGTSMEVVGKVGCRNTRKL